MGLLFSNWLEEGFYEEDGYGDLTRIKDPDKIHKAKKEGRLFEHDGMGMCKVNEEDEIRIKHGNKYKG